MAAKSLGEKINLAYGDKTASSGKNWWTPAEAFTLITDPDHKTYADLFEPRTLLPLEEERITDIEARGQITPIIVWEDGETRGKPNLIVIDGSRRVLHILEINRRRAKERPPRDAMSIRFETVKAKTIGDLQLLKLSANMGGESETPATLAPKIRLALKHNSEDTVRSSMKKSQQRFA